MVRRRTLPFALAGSLGFQRATRHRPFWPRDLRRGALLLGLSAAVFWSSFALGRVAISTPGSGPIYVDLLLGWVAVILHVAAWPNLWLGLQDLRGRCPRDDHPVIAWRSFLVTLGLILAAVVILPIEYHSFASSEPWVLVTYVTAFPYLGWTFVPILALHGVLFGRVAYYLDPRSRYLADGEQQDGSGVGEVSRSRVEVVGHPTEQDSVERGRRNASGSCPRWVRPHCPGDHGSR